MTLLARTSGNSGVAALELALLLPPLVALFLGTADFSFAYHQQLQLTSALASTAEYAFIKGQTESGTTLTSDVTGFATKVTATPFTSVTANYNNGLSATSCYCVGGSPPVYSAAMTCGAACTDGSGSTAGKFISITGAVTYTALFSLDQVFFSNPITQTVTARLQ